jgi:hypothetical protein
MTVEIEVALNSMDAMRRSIRRALEGVDAKGLNWNPLPDDANSLYAIVSHLCTSESTMIHQRIGGQAVDGEGHAAFAAQGDDPQALLGRLDELGNTTHRLLDGLTPEDMDRSIDPGGGRPQRTARAWLQMHVRHMALHLGHIEITKQFYEAGIVTGR